MSLLPNGNFVTTWTHVDTDKNTSNIIGQVFDKKKVTNEIVVNSSSTSKSVSPTIESFSRNFIIAWQQFEGKQSPNPASDIFLQLFK